MSELKLSTEELTHLWQAAQDQAVTGVPAPFHFAKAVVELQTRRSQPEATPQAVADAVMLDKIGKSIGYGRAIQILGQLWDDMLQAKYADVRRHQESMFRRDDIERIEAGLPIGRKVVYFQKRGRKGQITAWIPFDTEIPNVARIISDTPLYGLPQFTPTPDAPQAKGSEGT